MTGAPYLRTQQGSTVIDSNPINWAYARLACVALTSIALQACGGGDNGTSAGTGSGTGTGTTTTTTTAAVLCTYSQSTLNSDESVDDTSISTWSCDDTSRNLTANGLPNHEVGTFPGGGNPNAITPQTIDITFPVEPEIASAAGTDTRTVAYALNGVKFEVGTAGTCDDAGDCNAAGNGGSWSMEAVGLTPFNFGTDNSNGHVQPTGAYHYHGIPEDYLTLLGKGTAMTLVGWAVDGFPIYARYGYTTATDASSAIAVMTGSYVLDSVPDIDRPNVATYPLGAFTSDYNYSEGSGNLDECNGRTGVTPEFPEGIYHYYLTDSFPYGQRCVKGTATGAGMPAGPPPG